MRGSDLNESKAEHGLHQTGATQLLPDGISLLITHKACSDLLNGNIDHEAEARDSKRQWA
jgi:hypothetical protein